ncbi:MAG: alkylphosphonate utilization protein [Oligoflexia bacterium]|nr:alkylphosphonate utilization protein [Oligoflexia bacterium]
MSEENKNCPKCNSPYGYKDGNLWICPECFFEWTTQETTIDTVSLTRSTHKYLDANGVQLQNGDTVTTVKDLKVGKDTIKSGTKVKNIKLLDEPVDGHDISCKIPEYGSIYLKCSVVKKVK